MKKQLTIIALSIVIAIFSFSINLSFRTLLRDI
jgi:hypothetical protein